MLLNLFFVFDTVDSDAVDEPADTFSFVVFVFEPPETKLTILLANEDDFDCD